MTFFEIFQLNTEPFSGIYYSINYRAIKHHFYKFLSHILWDVLVKILPKIGRNHSLTRVLFLVQISEKDFFAQIPKFHMKLVFMVKNNASNVFKIDFLSKILIKSKNDINLPKRPLRAKMPPKKFIENQAQTRCWHCFWPKKTLDGWNFGEVGEKILFG